VATYREDVVRRTWGYYVDHLRTERCVFKTLYIRPGERTSVQMHRHRREHWIVEQGEGIMYSGGSTVTVYPGSEATVECEEWHWLRNTGDTELVVREMQTGYCSEDDIERAS